MHFCLIRSRSIVANLPDVKTRMETLSESMMNQSALNDLPETDSGMVSSKCTKKISKTFFKNMYKSIEDLIKSKPFLWNDHKSENLKIYRIKCRYLLLIKTLITITLISFNFCFVLNCNFGCYPRLRGRNGAHHVST